MKNDSVNETGGDFASKDLLGSVHTLGNQWWVVIMHAPKRLVMKRADSELQTIRLRLHHNQCQMAKLLKVSQAQYCRLESGIAPLPTEMLEGARQMLTIPAGLVKCARCGWHHAPDDECVPTLPNRSG